MRGKSRSRKLALPVRASAASTEAAGKALPKTPRLMKSPIRGSGGSSATERAIVASRPKTECRKISTAKSVQSEQYLS
jgi:hypothetical protein